MNNFNKPINTIALDVTLSALFSDKGRDDTKRVYEMIHNGMTQAYAEGVASRDADLGEQANSFNVQFAQAQDGVDDLVRNAERIGFQKGRANALFEQAVERLNAEAAKVSPALAPQAACAEETALVNAASALG